MTYIFTRQHLVIDGKDYIEFVEGHTETLLSWSRFGPISEQIMQTVEGEQNNGVLRRFLEAAYGGQFGVIFPAEKKKPVYGQPIWTKTVLLSPTLQSIEQSIAGILGPNDELQGKSLSVVDLEINVSENFPRDENAKGGTAE